MSYLSILLLCDGTSDFYIERPIEWIVAERFAQLSFRVVKAQTLVPAREPLSNRLKKAVRDYSPNLIVCHRDAEKQSHELRVTQIEDAVRNAEIDIPVVPAVPVRMTEAWLLFDENAIRLAANNSRGTIPLDLPKIDRLEDLPDPKQLLFESIRLASGLAAQRSRRFDIHHARHRLGELIEDFSPLRQLTAFRKFEDSLIGAVETAAAGRPL